MATDFSTVAAHPAPYQHHGYKSSTSSAYNVPLRSGTTSPMNSSPTSPRSTSHLPQYPNYPTQIRQQKPPIYVPAALRRTERPAPKSPPKVDSAIDTPEGSWGNTSGNLASDNGAVTFPRISNEDLHSIYGDAPLSPVSGPITRNHWQPDSSTAICTASACQTPFGIFTRKHHCRKCGHIFCWQHSQRQVKLNEHALFHPDGELQRACDRCHSQFREWEQMRSSRANSESSGSTTAVRIDTPTAAKRPDAHRVGSLATSFQGAWNWSTF
ncbi:hypothetical protein B0J11DRAFT_549199 [Dendryphion nanum]|uniref:FYVE-type domain-containing protein n=1 Tax=Dendryphion nanum TaxID=256645 RepID=A0A9P9DZM6_9PLEO|nr:hypothetical protein B0J11DRAFT_549199 [Dendryphion nanum]